ncbi:hypothetical protein TNCV_3383041, partial [Trichonephila clavipes]
MYPCRSSIQITEHSGLSVPQG